MNDLFKAGLYDYVSVDFILAGAKMRLGLRETTVDDLYLKDLIYEGSTQLQNLGTQIPAIAQLAIEDYKSKLPPGFLGFTKNWPIVYVDASGNAVDGTSTMQTEVISAGGSIDQLEFPAVPVFSGMSGPAFANNAFYKNSPYGSGFTLMGTAQVQEGYIFFSTNVTAQYVKISYNSVNVNKETGQLLIPAYCARALTAYACYKWSVTNEKPMWVQIYGPEWSNGKQECRAIPNMPDSFQYQLINRVMKSLI